VPEPPRFDAGCAAPESHPESMPAPPLDEVAFAVGDALRQAGVDATLTGGSCASIHCGGAYNSLDIDFVLYSSVRIDALDGVLATLGYQRDGRRYVHPTLPYFIEFLPGPVAVGDDATVTPIELRRGHARIQALSPTDSCRDRLAAYYHWDDLGSLDVAVLVALSHRLDLETIRRWSRQEGALQKYDTFLERLRSRRRSRRRSARGGVR
jgi:hypothetical protein